MLTPLENPTWRSPLRSVYPQEKEREQCKFNGFDENKFEMHCCAVSSPCFLLKSCGDTNPKDIKYNQIAFYGLLQFYYYYIYFSWIKTSLWITRNWTIMTGLTFNKLNSVFSWQWIPQNINDVEYGKCGIVPFWFEWLGLLSSGFDRHSWNVKNIYSRFRILDLRLPIAVS